MTPMKAMPARSFGCAGRPSTTTVPPPPPALSGTRLEANAARTPGSASTRLTTSSTRRSLASSGSYTARQIEPHRHERLRIEPEIGPAEVHERPDEQQRAHERHERKRHLHDHQRTSQQRPGDAVAARAFLQCLVQVAARGLQRRKQSKHQRRRRGDEHGVGDRPPVQFPSHVVRHLVGRNACGNQPRADRGQDDAERHADQTEHHALGEQLPDDAAAARAKRRARRESRGAGRRPSPAGGSRRSSRR